jgi:hypothetical protein
LFTASNIRSYQITKLNIPKGSHFSTLRLFENKVVRTIVVPHKETERGRVNEKHTEWLTMVTSERMRKDKQAARRDGLRSYKALSET